MKRNLFFAVIAAFTLSLSCAKEEGDNSNPGGQDSDFVTVTLIAGSESTKTTLGDVVGGMRAISWEEGDEIKVVYGEGADDYTLAQAKSSGQSTEFTISVPKDATTLYAVYPADACQSVSEGNVVVNIPSLQDGVFASANIAVARTTVAEHQLLFKNVVSYVLTDITDESVRGVRIEGAGLALAGDVTVSFDEAGAVELGEVTNSSDNVFTTVKGTGTCYIALAAGVSFNDGVKITFTNGEGSMLSDLSLKKADFVLQRAAVLDAGALDAAGVISYFVSPSGNGTKDGLSSANAWSIEEFVEWLSTENPEVPAGKVQEAPFNIYLAGGTYTLPSAVTVPTKGRDLNIVSPGQNAVIDGSAVAGDRLIYVNADGKISISGVTFSGHVGAGTGKVVLWFQKPSVEGMSQEVSLISCIIKDNKNTSGVGAGVVFNNAGINYVKDCTFSGNVAGGASALNIDNAGTNVILDGCLFSENECISYSNSQNSGAIKVGNGTATISDCRFENNKISIESGAGAAVWVDNCEKVTFDEGCLFKGNTSVGNGGAVFVTGGKLIEFDDCDFQGNSADSYGGAVCLGSLAKHNNNDFDVVFKNGCTFTDNVAVNGGGAIILVSDAVGTFSTDNCTFARNTVSGTSGGKGGGAIRIEQNLGKKVTLANTTFESNRAYRHGGAIANYRDTDLDVNHCTFTENRLTAGRGGAIYIGGDSDCDNNVHIFGNTIFTSNAGYDSGGAVAVTNDGNGKVSNSEDYYTCRSNITIENSSFVTNTSLARGGALDLKTSGISTIKGCLFDGNYTTNENANGCGAGINIEYGNTFQKYPDLRGQVNISECRFIGNHTKHTYSGASFDPRGGAIAIPAAGGGLANNVDVRVDKCYFKDNVARQAAAIRSYTGKTGDVSLFVNACSFEGNRTYGNHGVCIAVFNAKEFCMNNCSFRNNYRPTNGGAYALSWVSVAATPMVMSNNTIIGQLQHSDGDVADYDAGYGLIRLESAANTSFINNVMLSTKTAWCAPVFCSNAANGSISTYSNKFSSHTMTVASSDDFNGIDWEANASYFGSLAWTANTTAGQEYKSGWIWDGTLANGTPATKNALSDVNNKIKAANEAFHTWLGSVGGLDKDQAGNARGAETWPGAYQKQ